MENGAGVPQPVEGLPTRRRPLYDDYGPVKPGLLRRSAVPSAEPPTTPAITRLLFSFQRFCFPLLELWSAVAWSRCIIPALVDAPKRPAFGPSPTVTLPAHSCGSGGSLAVASPEPRRVPTGTR
jgi:hypothetical protein